MRAAKFHSSAFTYMWPRITRTGRDMFKLKAPMALIGILLPAIFLAACGDSATPEPDSNATPNKEVVSRFIEDFKNKANHEIVDELMSPDFVHHLTDPRFPEDREAIKLLGQSIVGAFRMSRCQSKTCWRTEIR